MKRYFIFLLFFTAFNSYAQTLYVDSLKQILRTEIADTTRVLLLDQLAYHYFHSRPDTSLIMAQQAIALARQGGFAKGEAYCLTTLGSIFWLTGNYPKSLEYYLKALKKFEMLKDPNGAANALGGIGNIYSELGDEKQSVICFWRIKEIADFLNNPKLLLWSISSLGDSYEKLDQLDSARIYTHQSYELAIRIIDPITTVLSLNNLGNIYSKMHRGEIAMDYYRQSLSMGRKLKYNDVLCETTLGMAELFKKSGQADSTFHYARLCLAIAIESGFTKMGLKASSFLSGYYKDLNRWDSAFYYQSVAIAAKDSLFSQEKIKEVQNLNFEEKIRQQEIEESNRLAKEERKSNIQLLAIVTFIIFFFALLFVFSKRHANPAVIKFLGLLGLLLLFEFISLFLHPYIAAFTHHKPIFMLLILVAIASMLIPLKHALQRWVKEKLAQKKLNAITVSTEEDKVLTSK